MLGQVKALGAGKMEGMRSACEDMNLAGVGRGRGRMLRT